MCPFSCNGWFLTESLLYLNQQVDKIIGKDHLFKKSIILVKAWCFYESRILGAHHGLLSTYSLEVLVLYIFHVYHHLLRGPLEVLYRFIKFFSRFDWEEFCLSPAGPVRLDELHMMNDAIFLNSHGSKLLSNEFLSACRERYGTLLENNQGKTFSRKFMNLVDPLRPFNNLGRSVNSGNLVRIYSAFAYGAARLEKLLQSSKDHVTENLASFFRNTQKHCEGQRPDAGLFSFQGSSACDGESRKSTSKRIPFMSGNPHNLDYDDKHMVSGNKPGIDISAFAKDAAKPSDPNASFERMVVQNNECAHGSPSSSEAHEQVPSTEMQSSSPARKEDEEEFDFQKDVYRLTSVLKLDSSPMSSSETASCGSEELSLQSHANSSEADCRETDTAILEGDYDACLDNLRCAQVQVVHLTAQAHIHSGILSWGDPGRSILFHNSVGRNLPIHGNMPCLPNGPIFTNLPKNQKGTGTFLPTVNTSFERDRRGYSNGLRSPRRNIDSVNLASQNTSLAFKSRSTMPRRRDGQNRSKSRRVPDDKVREIQGLSTEDTASGNVHSATMSVPDDFSVLLQGHVEDGPERLPVLDHVTRSRESGLVPASQSNKDISIESLEFGSFGPGFLAGGLQSLSESKEHVESFVQARRFSSPADVLDIGDTSKIGNHSDKHQSAYSLKDEDFPPLPLSSPTAAGGERITSHAHDRYHPVRFLAHSCSPTKIV
ncbi:hypothetical protein KP509_03G027900 [Ceratopteris richardii]|uniref:PAP/OAS1 substrate-binding-related domain-containing protein n=1 Tax=Ceratopteris richardii TaxID=49495 RepID=A0A8T2V196_CERRI|nr:hypothetical protein KP509_03G027900 [Ceratopteris richardii]